MWAIFGPRSALDHPIYQWSLVPHQSLSAIEWHQSGKPTYCHALFLLPPETMESQLHQQSLSPGRTQIRSYCSKLNPPPWFRKPRRNTQAHDAATHLICNRRLVRGVCIHTLTAEYHWQQFLVMPIVKIVEAFHKFSKMKSAKCFRFHVISPNRLS